MNSILSQQYQELSHGWQVSSIDDIDTKCILTIHSLEKSHDKIQ